MKKAIAIHIVFLILYLLAYMHVTDGVDVQPLGKFFNVFLLVFVQICVAGYCDLQDLYRDKNSK